MMDYPDELIRGIPNETYMEDGYPNVRLFNEYRENPERDDDYKEASINWNDDEHAIEFIFNQVKNGEPQFKEGGALISRHELERLRKSPVIKGHISYERREDKDNKNNIYHGNILIKKNTSSSKRNLIASAIAAYCVIDVKKR